MYLAWQDVDQVSTIFCFCWFSGNREYSSSRQSTQHRPA